MLSLVRWSEAAQGVAILVPHRVRLSGRGSSLLVQVGVASLIGTRAVQVVLMHHGFHHSCWKQSGFRLEFFHDRQHEETAWFQIQKSHFLGLVLTWRVDSARIVVHRRSSLSHAGIHERRHHHPAGIKPEDMWGIVAPLGVARARRGRVTWLLPVLHLVYLFLYNVYSEYTC